MKVNKPWGYYEVLYENEDKTYLVKKLVVNPKQRLSLQKHEKRREHWILVEGECNIVRDKELDLFLPAFSEYVHIDKNMVHRIHNQSDDICVLIEVQVGLCDEDDIIRLEDDYGR